MIQQDIRDAHLMSISHLTAENERLKDVLDLQIKISDELHDNWRSASTGRETAQRLFEECIHERDQALDAVKQLTDENEWSDHKIENMKNTAKRLLFLIEKAQSNTHLFGDGDMKEIGDIRKEILEDEVPF